MYACEIERRGEREKERGGRKGGRKRVHEVVCASCRIHSPASAKMGQTRSQAQLSRSASLLLTVSMGAVNSSYHMNTPHGINETSRMTLIQARHCRTVTIIRMLREKFGLIFVGCVVI